MIIIKNKKNKLLVHEVKKCVLQTIMKYMYDLDNSNWNIPNEVKYKLLKEQINFMYNLYIKGVKNEK